MHWLEILAIGAGVGFLGGLFGKGGSAVATPLLAAIGIPPIIAVAAPLPATIPGTLVAHRRYRQQGFSDPRLIRWTLAFGVPATIAGALTTRWVDGDVLIVATDVIVALLGLRVLVAGTGPADPAADHETPARMAAVAIAVGVLAGLLASSGGFLLVPLYLAVLSMPIKRALASSLAVGAVLAVPGTVVHAALGHIDWGVAGIFAAASIPLSSLGAKLALRMPAHGLERIYGAGLLLLGTVLLLAH